MADIPDLQARTLAATTFDRNVVVTAGAGTGKTTLLVDRLIHLIVKSPDPVPLPAIVALTFMDKAANEIKMRLRERLLDMATAPASAVDLLQRYRLSSAELASRAEAALLELERSQIGTIHSFAAHLLRLHPVEAGVDPRFEPDQGVGFEEHFRREWEQWLDAELGENGARHVLWRRVLQRTGIDSLRGLAGLLVKDLVPLEKLAAELSVVALSRPIQAWLEERHHRAGELLAAQLDGEKESRQVEKLLEASRALFQLVLERGPAGVRALPEATAVLLDEKEPGSKPPAGWEQRDFDEARALIQTAKAVLRTEPDYFRDVMAVLKPFAETCRQRFLEHGAITFDGLLARARDLLQRHPAIRERLKRQFKAVLVDEFQDTDPVQYEIILFLCERAGRPAAEWQAVQLEPGKLFIVGDPKQSIFAFRRADIEAFHEVGRRMIEQGALALTLTANFRSHHSILSAVNGLFGRLLIERRGLQPPYHALDPEPGRRTGAGAQGVMLRFVKPAGEEEELTAAEAVRAEAEALARWLQAEVIGREVLTRKDGPPRKVEPGDVALLFRTLTQSREYLDALRRHGLSYVAEGEKHFYRRQEVIDFVNLLRCIQHPDDTVALAGVLRSALGTLTDRELVELAGLRALDYRRADLGRHPKAEHLRRLYTTLHALHRECPLRPLPDALDLVCERLPALELAAASLHGEQAVANLWKVRDLAEDLVADPEMTLASFVELLSGRIAEPPEESESGLAEESREAVRVLSIHKAKGLEFPIVVLVGVQAGPSARRETIQVQHDWSTDIVGIRLELSGTLGGVFASEKLEARSVAEYRRLLYVGMTRARERLILSGALTTRSASGNFLSLLREGLGEGVGKPDVCELPAGEGRIAQAVLEAEEGRPKRRLARDRSGQLEDDLQAFNERHQRRVARWESCRVRSVICTPSTEVHAISAPAFSGQAMTAAATVGRLVHKALESWSYRENIKVLLSYFDREGLNWIEDDGPGNREDVLREARQILEEYTQSNAYAELCGVTILGREVPFIMPYMTESARVGAGGARVLVAPANAMGDGPSPVLMEGRIDLLYEKEGQLWAADYKTDRLVDAELDARAETYRPQAGLYSEAVRRTLGRTPAGFRFIFLRLGRGVTLAV